MKNNYLTLVFICLSIHLSLFSQSTGKGFGDVICTVSTDKEIYIVGENVEITVQLFNSGNETVTIIFPYACLINYIIDYNYNHLEGMLCAAMLTEIVLAPGQSFQESLIHTPSQYILGLGVHNIDGMTESPPYFSSITSISVVEEIQGTTLFTETFETYTPNQQLCGQNNTLWKPWSGIPGTTMDPFVKNNNPRSGNNSLLIEGLNDAVLLLGDKSSGRYSASFYLFVPAGFTAYYNLLSGYTDAIQPSINGQVYFDLAGQCRIDAGIANAATFSYNYNQWIFIENIVDIDSDSAWIKVDGIQKVAWKWSKGAGVTNQWTVRQWSGIDFYAWNATGTPKYYLDDISFEILETPASALVTPADLHFYSPDSLTRSFLIENTGQSPLSYEITSEYYFPNLIFPTKKQTLVSELPIESPYSDEKLKKDDPGYLSAACNREPIEFTDELRENPIVHFDGNNIGRLGFSASSTQQIAVRFPYNRLGEYVGRKLEAVHIFVRDLPINTSIIVCRNRWDVINSPGDTLCIESFVPLANQWNTISLNIPDAEMQKIWDSEEIWVIFKHTQISTGRSIGFDGGPSNSDGSWYLSGNEWKQFYKLYPNYCFNWNIRLELSGDQAFDWLKCENSQGIISPGSSQIISATANADSLIYNVSHYPAHINFHSNDPSSPLQIRSAWFTVCDSIQIPLKMGWNLISTIINPINNSPEIVFQDAIDNNSLEVVTGYVNQQGVFFDPDGPPFLNTLTTINSEAGYWVKVNQDTEIKIYGGWGDGWNWWPPEVFLTAGWNLVGCKYFYSPLTPEVAFENLIFEGVLQTVTSYNEGGLFFDPNGLPFLNTLTEVNNGFGYWVKVTTDCFWYPSNPLFQGK
jgi:hypothetical protein